MNTGQIKLLLKMYYMNYFLNNIKTSSIEYNFESPLKDSVIATLLQCGFELVENVENHYMDSKLIQEDFIFINTNNKIELIGNKLSLKNI